MAGGAKRAGAACWTTFVLCAVMNPSMRATVARPQAERRCVRCRGASRVFRCGVTQAIKAIWLIADNPRQAKPALPLWLPFYEKRHGQLESKVKAKVLSSSWSTIDLIGALTGSLWASGVVRPESGQTPAQSDPIRTITGR